jgi:biotin carboxylase
MIKASKGSGKKGIKTATNRHNFQHYFQQVNFNWHFFSLNFFFEF